jgi:hypothetical protein
MKKYLLLGLMAFNLNAIGSEISPTSHNKISKEGNNKTKTLIIDLDKEKKDAKERGDAFDIIKGIIPLGHNDEVTFLGKKVLIARPVTLYVNDVLKKTIKNAKEILSIKTSELAVGDTVTIKNRKGTTLVEKKIVK